VQQLLTMQIFVPVWRELKKLFSMLLILILTKNLVTKLNLQENNFNFASKVQAVHKSFLMSQFVYDFLSIDKRKKPLLDSIKCP